MSIRLMSHNVWGMYAPDVVKKVANRASLMKKIYFEYLPDVIGTQEFSRDIRENGLPELISQEYSEIGSGDILAELGMENMYTPIFYRTKTCAPTGFGYHLFDRKFNNGDSKGIFYATFIHLPTGKSFSVLNTHYWWKRGDADNLARVRNSLDALEIARGAHAPVFLMGDLNCNISSAAFITLTDGGMSDAQAAQETVDISSHHAYPDFDYDKNEFFGAPKPVFGYDRAIDHILVDKAHAAGVRRFDIITTDDACNTSDHCPLYIDFDL